MEVFQAEAAWQFRSAMVHSREGGGAAWAVLRQKPMDKNERDEDAFEEDKSPG
jgi:hypothetical protein